MEWLVLAIGLLALATGAVMMGRAQSTGENPGKEVGDQPTRQEPGQPWPRTSPDYVPSQGFRARQTQDTALRAGWEDWRWEPAGLLRPALPSTVTPDTTVLLKGPQVTVPVTLPHPWIIGPAFPLSLPPLSLASLRAAASQTGDLLLWPWQAGAEDLPDRFALLVPARKLPHLRGTPEDPRLSLSSLVILDLRLGLPARLAKARQAPSQSADGKLPRWPRTGSEPGATVRWEHQLTQIVQNLRTLSGGVPILAGIPAAGSQDLALDALASSGFDGAAIFAAPLAAGLPLPLSGNEVGLPLARGIATARAAREGAGLSDWPLLVAGRCATPADCLKAVALGATAVILDPVLTWPEFFAYQEEQQAQDQTEVEAQEGLAAAAAELLTGFARETESLLRILCCRRLGELPPQSLIHVGDHPAPHEQPDAVPPAAVVAAPTSLPPPLPAATMPDSPVPPAGEAARRDPPSKREFVRPRLLAPRPPRRIRVLTPR